MYRFWKRKLNGDLKIVRLHLPCQFPHGSRTLANRPLHTVAKHVLQKHQYIQKRAFPAGVGPYENVKRRQLLLNVAETFVRKHLYSSQHARLPRLIIPLPQNMRVLTALSGTILMLTE